MIERFTKGDGRSILWLLEQTMRDLQNARRRAGSKRVRAHLRLAIARIN